jgi:hypothetical protein
MRTTRQIGHVDFKVPPPIGTTMEADGNIWTLAEVKPPHVRLVWQAPCPKKPGRRIYMETALSFAVEHMDLERDQESSIYFDEPPKLGTKFCDRFGWTWQVASTAPAPCGEGFNIGWITRCPVTGQVFLSTSGRRVWGSKLHRSKIPGELVTDPANGGRYVVVSPDAGRKGAAR